MPIPVFTGSAPPPPPTTPTTPTQPRGPVIGTPRQVIRRSLSLEGAEGDRIDFSHFGDNGFVVIEPGPSGLGAPPVTVNRRVGAGPGSRWLSTRRQERTIDVPVLVMGDTVTQFRDRLSRLMRVLDDRRGPSVLHVGDGFGRSRYTEVIYTGGAELDLSVSSSGETFQALTLSFVAPWPFFKSDTVVTGAIGAGTGVPFIPFGAPLRTSPSTVLGTFQMTNPGDADAHFVWTLRGPGGPATFRNVTDNATLIVSSVLGDGVVRIIDTAAKTITDINGVSKYSELGTAPRFWALPPGVTEVEVTLTGATSASGVSFEFRPEWKAAT